MSLRRTNRSRPVRAKAAPPSVQRYRHVVVPGLGWRPRPAAWQVVGCAAAVAVAIAGLAWVFTGGAEALAWPAVLPTR